MTDDEIIEHRHKFGFSRSIMRSDKESSSSNIPRKHNYEHYCPWCYDEGAYDDNLRTGCGQEHVVINIVDDRLYNYIEKSEFDDKLKRKCLLDTVSVSDLVSSLTSPTKILIRNTPPPCPHKRFRPYSVAHSSLVSRNSQPILKF